jgi:hypothetical protein
MLSSAAKAEMGALFYNAKEAAWIKTTLEDMGLPQPSTLKLQPPVKQTTLAKPVVPTVPSNNANVRP